MKMRKLFIVALLLSAMPLLISAQAVTVYPDQPGGPVKMMNGTNNWSHDGIFTTASKHMRKCFPDIKIGGPAFAGSYDQRWIDGFLKAVRKEKAPLDFFSYHKYATHPDTLVRLTREIRAKLDGQGFRDIPMHLGEWNYVSDWGADGKEYSSQVRRSIKGAAFTAAVMSTLQTEQVEMLYYYDLSGSSSYNGIYDRSTGNPLPCYYVFLSWAKLRRLGTTLKVDTGDLKDIFVTAARSADGKLKLNLKTNCFAFIELDS